MRPYYEDDAVTIYHGDCREILPTLDRADLVLTDPPYGIDGPMGTLQASAQVAINYTTQFRDDESNLRRVVVPAIQGLIERTPAVILTPGNRHFASYPQPQSFGAFYYPSTVSVQTFGNLDAQPIFYYGKNPRGERFGVVLSWLVTEKAEEFGHPCTKPIRMWKRLLASVSLPGMSVLDPFMGSGTTLRAAKDLGRKAIGIEIEERYCEIAAQRMSQMVLEFDAV